MCLLIGYTRVLMKKLKLIILYLLLAAALLATAVSAVAWYWVGQPVALDSERIDYVVDPGSRPRSIAATMNKAGIHVNEDAFVALARLTGLDKQLQAGAYEAVQGDTPRVLLERMANGDMTQTRLTLVEGWSYQRIRQALRDDPKVGQTLTAVSDEELLRRLGADSASTEGIFYPDTYVFAPG